MRVHHVAFIALLALPGYAHAQTAGGTSGPAGSSLGATPSPGTPTPGNPTGAPATLPSPAPGTTTGSSVGTTAPPVAGVPNTSTPGTIGTGASPSGLPGDDPANPGFPKGPSNTRR